MGSILTEMPPNVKNIGILNFTLLLEIESRSASDWSGHYLSLLKIIMQESNDISEFLAGFTDNIKPPNRATKLLKDLAVVSGEYLSIYKSNKSISSLESHYAVFQDSLIKTLYMLRKFSNIEALVDQMMVFLFERLGFYADRLFAFPQISHEIDFGGGEDNSKARFYYYGQVFFL